MFIEYLWQDPALYITWVILVMFSICCHEMAHAWWAAREGDHTAADGGYLTMNPVRVMGLNSLILLVLFGIAFGAVPVNPGRMRRRISAALVSLAGPLANLVLAGGFAGMAHLGSRMGIPVVSWVAAIGAKVNVFLFCFNMLPVPILDGWEVFSAVIPAMRRVGRAQAQRVGFIILIIILFAGLHRYIADVAFTVAGLMLPAGY